MGSSAWLNRGTLAGLLFGILAGGGAVTAFFLLREQPKDTANAEPPKQEPAKQEVAKQEPVTKVRVEQALKVKAQLGSQALSQAIEAYIQNPANAGITEEERAPRDLRDLYQPPFGGPSFLRNGEADTLDPWGKPYHLTEMYRKDGTGYQLVVSVAPDGTLISQFGIGVEKAFPGFKK